MSVEIEKEPAAAAADGNGNDDIQSIAGSEWTMKGISIGTIADGNAISKMRIFCFEALLVGLLILFFWLLVVPQRHTNGKSLAVSYVLPSLIMPMRDQLGIFEPSQMPKWN